MAAEDAPIVLRQPGGNDSALALPCHSGFDPAPGWSLDDARGYMAFDGSGDVDARRLVLLKDLVQWRIQSKRCPLRAAVNDIINGLSATEAAQWLYLVKPGDYARLIQTDDCFSGERSYWGQFAKVDSAASCGLLGLLYSMREHWGADGLPDADQVQRKGLQALESAAIRMDVAHALWGWGQAVAPALALPDPAQLVPVEGWRLDDARGYMACDGTDAGRLVLLRDLVQWIIQAKPCPLRVAVEDVIARLSVTGAASWLYLVKEGDYARALRADDRFRRGMVLGVLGDAGHSEITSVGGGKQGLPGLLCTMREHWGANGLPDAIRVKRDRLEVLESVAIRMDVAHALWGWGTVAVPATAADASPGALADWPALVAYRKANPGSDWGLGNQLDILRSELERRMDGRKETKSAALGAMAKELGHGTRQSLSKVLSTERKRAKQVASAPVATVVRDGKVVNGKAA